MLTRSPTVRPFLYILSGNRSVAWLLEKTESPKGYIIPIRKESHPIKNLFSTHKYFCSIELGIMPDREAFNKTRSQ